MPGSVATLGSANYDFVVRAERLPGPGETVFGASFDTVAGGKGLNQAVAARRAGVAVDFIGAVGLDSYGDELISFLEREQIGTDALSRVAGQSTGTAHIIVQESGENSIIVVPGANGTLTELTAEARAVIQRSQALMMQFEVPQKVLLEGASLAKQHGSLTVLTPAPALTPVQGLLEHIDIVVPNQHEVTLIAGITDTEAATQELSRGRICVTTLGEDGALVARDGEIIERVPARRTAVVDTTAAGDTFVGMLVARLIAGSELSAALHWATTAAAIAVTRPGATSSMPSREAVERALTDWEA